MLAIPEPSEDVAAQRDIFVDLMRLPDANRHLAGLMSRLSLRYDLPGGGHPLAGHRMTDPDLLTHAGLIRLSALPTSGHALLLDLAGIVPADLRLPPRIDLVRGGHQRPGRRRAARPSRRVHGAADDAVTCEKTLLPAIAEHLARHADGGETERGHRVGHGGSRPR